MTIAISLAMFFFREEIRSSVIEVYLKTAKIELPPEITDENIRQEEPTNDKWVPEGFKGPTGEPHIIGPKSDPPNY